MSDFKCQVKYIDYVVLYTKTAEELEETVKTHFAKGWIPLGGAVMCDDMFMQTLVLPK